METIIVSDDQAKVILSTEDDLPIKDCFGKVIGRVHPPAVSEVLAELTEQINKLREQKRCES